MKRVKKPNIPSSVRITPEIAYEIVYVDEFKDGNTLGEMRPQTRQIAILNGQSNTELTKTFIHEVLHAISDENEINLTEKQVLKLENALYRVLRLNEII